MNLRILRRVGLDRVLADLNRVGRKAEVPGDFAGAGFTWQRTDRETRRWYPQGITAVDERPVLLVSWYARKVWGWLLGSRISVIDLSDDERPRYRHVRLADRWLRPMRVHAGGLAIYGNQLFVAAGSRGIRVFCLDDIVRLGYGYVLRLRASYVLVGGGSPMICSFLSVDGDSLIVGEYGRKGGSHRLARYSLDSRTRLLASEEPIEFHDQQVERMQGACVVDGTWFVTSSMGEGNPGDLWVGGPGDWERHRGVLPTGPEDLTYWSDRQQVWSVTEWPGRRWIYRLDTRRVGE